MKSELKIQEKEKPLPTFPLLARYRDGTYKGLVVLFINSREGTVLCEGKQSQRYKIGHTESEWSSVLNQAEWEISPEGAEVTLTQ